MRIIILVLTLIFSSCSSIKTESLFVNGVLAESKEYDIDGNIREEVIFDGGKIVNSKEYFKNGILKSQLDVIDNIYIDYNEDGTIKEEGEIDKMTLGFLSLAGLSSLTSLTSLVTMPEGSGVSKEYYSNGNVKEEVGYKNGKLEGEFKEYYEDGTLASKGQYKNGLIEGLVIEYYHSKK